MIYTGPAAEDLARIPAALTCREQWVLWRGEDRVDLQTGEVKLTKIPVDPQTLRNASSTDPITWGTFQQCVMALPVALEEWEVTDTVAYRGGGLGFVFSDDDPYSGVDLDHCRNPDTGELAPRAQIYTEALASYTELSPSGAGVHVWVEGMLPPHGRKHGQVEMYNSGRFFTITGWHVPDTPKNITAHQEALYEVHGRVFGPQVLTAADGTTRCYCPTCDYLCTLTAGGLCPACSTPPIAPVVVTPALSATSLPRIEDAALLAKAGAAQHGAGTRFRALLEGDWSGYASHSEADLGLCVRLAFWTRDPDQIDRLFRQSGLMRCKWDTKHGAQTYGQMTVAKALALQAEQYDSGTRAHLVIQDPDRPYHKPLPRLRTTLRGLSTRLRRL